MANPDKSLSALANPMDFQDPVLPEDLVDQLFKARRGVPEHWTQRPELQRAPQPEPEGTIFEAKAHHLITLESQPSA